MSPPLHPGAVDVHPLLGGEPVLRAVATCERRGAGDVVVVHVGVGHGGDADAGLLGGELERADVPRRVHDQGVPPVVDQV